MTVVVAAAASFLTPVATPVNLMVMEPAGYRFTDYWKLGLPLMVLFLVVSVAVIPLAWPFSPRQIHRGRYVASLSVVPAKMPRPSASDRKRATSWPLTLLPAASSGGANVASPPLPGRP